MISVTQPRRAADDFLSSLQANLQGGGSTRTRRRGGRNASRQTSQQPTPVAESTIQSKTANANQKAKMRQQQQKKVAPQREQAKVTPKQKLESEPAVERRVTEPEIIEPKALPEEISILEEVVPQKQETVSSVPSLDLSKVPERSNPVVPAVLSATTSPTGKNNFYYRNQSNIFSWAAPEPTPVHTTTTTARANVFEREEIEKQTARELERRKWIQELERQIETKRSGASSGGVALSPALAAVTPTVTASPTQSSFLLGQNSLLDPHEAERRAEARRRARENQELIRRQVEEKERKKREEEERAKREEEAEARRVEAEARRMAEEVRREEERARKKEEAQLAQINQLRLKIEEAARAAEAEKRERRGGPSPAKTPASLQTSTEDRRSPVTHSPHQPRMPAAIPEPPVQAPTFVPEESPQESVVVQARPQPHLEPRVVQCTVSTQTACEVSCQTSTAAEEPSRLPSDTRLIQIPDRELSTIQKGKSSAGTRKKREAPQRKAPEKRSAPRKATTVQYDKNGRRIKPEPKKDPTPPAPAVVEEPPPTVTPAYRSVADILDDPERSDASSGLRMNENQVQMRYTSPKNEERSIPSAITERQNDILGQLERLRMGLKNRRMHIPTADGAI